jgi:hypothetical protein
VFPQRWQLMVSEGGQCVNAGIQRKPQNTKRKIPHVGLPSDALTLSLRQCKEVSLHGIAVDASSPCIILFLMKNSSYLLPDGQHFWDRVSLLEWAQPAAVVCLVPLFVVGAVQWKVKIHRLCM